MSEDKRKLRALAKGPACAFLVFQLEAGEVAGRLHFQGYVEFVEEVPTCVARQLMEVPTVKLSYATAPRENNVRYCSKVKTRVRGPWWWANGESARKRTRHARQEAQKKSAAVRRKTAANERERWKAEGTPINDGMDRWEKGLPPRNRPPRRKKALPPPDRVGSGSWPLRYKV